MRLLPGMQAVTFIFFFLSADASRVYPMIHSGCLINLLLILESAVFSAYMNEGSC